MITEGVLTASGLVKLGTLVESRSDATVMNECLRETLTFKDYDFSSSEHVG